MASRRLRIKPVANVPIRRGRTTENVEKVEDKCEQPKVHKPEEESALAINNESASERSDDQIAKQSNESNQDSTPSVDDTASKDGSTKTNSQVDVVKPSLLVGKRLRPAVNIAAISRPSKPQMVASKPDQEAASAHSENHTSSQKSDTTNVPLSDAEDKSSANVEKTPLRTLVRPSLSNTARTQGGDNAPGKEQKLVRRHLKAAVNIAALSRSSRQQKSNSLTADKEKFPQEAQKINFGITGITELPTKVPSQKSRYEKELMSTDEKLPDDAELPTETANISGDNSWSKYRFAKPVLQVQRTKDGPDGDSSKWSESGLPGSGKSDDDRSLSQASTISPPPPKVARLSKLITSKQHRGSAGESDDDNASKRTFGSASTMTPPCRRLSEVVVREDKEEKFEKKCIKPRVLSSSAVRFRKARMEFFSKFNGSSYIDRSRLTMMDLIFYNPVTNPMKSPEKKLSESSDKQPSAQVVPPVTQEQEEKLVEEQADDPEEGEEEEVAIPVPQVKVGPDGQIVLDERSLVIETTGAKKSREKLANSAVIVDTGTTGNGFYSRKFTKVKEWSKQETLKFYRALNIIGTDFLVMQSIFPKRSRRDLKMKFKREERINRLLVEKALRNPQDFDLTEMEKELAKEEEEEERRKQKMERGNVRKVKTAGERKKKPLKRNRSFLSRCMTDEDSGEVYKTRPKKKKQKTSNVYTKKPTASSESDEENEVDSHNLEVQKRLSESEESMENEGVGDSLVEAEDPLTKEGEDRQEEEDDDDEEIKKELQFLTRPPRPTRSGRIPQQKHPLSIASPTPKSMPKQIKQPVIPLKDLSNIEPGSLVVIATQSPTNPGHQVYKVFMVAPPSQTGGTPAIAPVTLSPKVMQSDSESNLQLYNSETLAFASTQPMCPATPHSPACSQLQTPLLPCSSNREPHSLNTSSQSLIAPPQPHSAVTPVTQSSFISNPQERTTFTANLQPNNTQVISPNTHFVPITKPEQQNMSIATSEGLSVHVSQLDSAFIPISSPQASSEQAETSISPHSNTSGDLLIQVSQSGSTYIPISRPYLSSEQAETSVNLIPILSPRASSEQAETSISPHSNTSGDLPIQVSQSGSTYTPISRPHLSSEQAETSISPHSNTSGDLPIQVSQSGSTYTPIFRPHLSSEQAETSVNLIPILSPRASSEQAKTSVNLIPISSPQASSEQAETSVNLIPISSPQASSEQAETSLNLIPISSPQASSEQAETSLNLIPISSPHPFSEQVETPVNLVPISSPHPFSEQVETPVNLVPISSPQSSSKQAETSVNLAPISTPEPSSEQAETSVSLIPISSPQPPSEQPETSVNLIPISSPQPPSEQPETSVNLIPISSPQPPSEQPETSVNLVPISTPEPSSEQAETSVKLIPISNLQPPSEQAETSINLIPISNLQPPSEQAETSVSLIPISSPCPPSEQAETSVSLIPIPSPCPPSEQAETSVSLIPISSPCPPSEQAETSVSLIPISSPCPPSEQAETSVSLIPISSPCPPSEQAETSVSLIPISSPCPPSEQAETSVSLIPISNLQPSSEQAETSVNLIAVASPQPSSEQAETSVSLTSISSPLPSSEQAETSVSLTSISSPQPSSEQAETSVNLTIISSPQPSSEQAVTSVILLQVQAPVVYLEDTASSNFRKQSDGCLVKDSEAQNSPAVSVTNGECPKSAVSSPNCGVRSPQTCTEGENNPRSEPQKNFAEGFEVQNNSSEDLEPVAITLKASFGDKSEKSNAILPASDTDS